MGMFDTITCESPLPFPEELDSSFRVALQTGEWQTKDLRCELTHYRLDPQGQLWRHVQDLEDGPARWLPVTDEVAKITFYTSVGPESSGWIEFEMVIVDGRLHRAIRLVSYRPVDPAQEQERVARREAWMRRALGDGA